MIENIFVQPLKTPYNRSSLLDCFQHKLDMFVVLSGDDHEVLIFLFCSREAPSLVNISSH
jgi:hypothetical protein